MVSTVCSIASVPTWGFPTPAKGAGTSLVPESCLLPGLLVNLLASVFFSLSFLSKYLSEGNFAFGECQTVPQFWSAASGSV